jgi:hypothetical protein
MGKATKGNFSTADYMRAYRYRWTWAQPKPATGGFPYFIPSKETKA